MTWSVEGTYIEACNCEAACPCIFLSPPTEGECSIFVGWHIENGHSWLRLSDQFPRKISAFPPGCFGQRRKIRAAARTGVGAK